MCPTEDLMPEHDAEREPVVLVVEDEVLIRLAVADHLRSCGFKVVEAGNGAEAQELILAGLSVDLVFSDVTMPGPMNGAALAQWLHQQMPDLPVILTSGVPSSLTAAKAACANIRSLAQKPYDYGVIVSEIRAILAARS